MSEYYKERKFAVSLAKKAGKIMLKHFDLNIAREWKEDNTPVTIADTIINQLVIDSVKKKYPDHKIISEEGSDLSGTGEYAWVCDPIDGTYPYSHGMPIAAFSLALVKDGQPVLGVLHDPFTGRMFYAEKGTGAFLNGKPVRVSSATDLKDKVISLGSFGRGKFYVTGVLSTLHEKGATVMMIKSICYSCALIAAGELVGAYYVSKYPWDGAAAKIVIEEAGGKITDLFGNEQRYDGELKGFVASNGELHSELLSAIAEVFKNKEL